INFALDRNEKVLVEGTQGTFLSLYHGTYPYVTSKDVTASAICADVGLGPKRVDQVILVFKAYVTRVGAGPLENELSKEEAQKRGWFEVATVTGRERRAAPFNFELARKAIALNSATQLAITKLDVMYPECAHVREYHRLSDSAKAFIEQVEKNTKVPVTLIGTGEDVYDTIDRRS
ncbi:MAG: adenylosuccinate synthetase, partial [Nitrososphaerales archaeon]